MPICAGVVRLLAAPVAVIALAGAAPAHAQPPPPSWSTAAAAGVARQELYPEVLDGRIYVAGGLLSPNTGYSAHFESYDPAADRWTRLATLPQARHHIALAAQGGLIYGVGGFSGGFPNWQAQADVYVYDPATDRWRSSVPLPEPRAEGVVAVAQERLYVVGGRVRASAAASHFNAHTDTARVEVFDPRTARWERLADAPSARNSAASAVIDGKLYVVGGRQALPQPDGSLRQVNLATLEVFDPASGAWTTRAPLPQAQGGLAAAAHRGKLYVFGGEQWTPAQKVFADSWVYDPAADRWAPVPPLPTARHGLGAATLGDRIHVFGGGLQVGGNAATNVHEVLVLGPP
ncbi:Kelch repeat-containing protein [Pseudorhodoferax sp.]|uniref:Kelch repeat-containing protein n=1 Tax=Pseudorhodoferax sp. TaxID=1993553 RepID=UPI002DD68F2E|nr:kelch repeat-containing protein [Pseudorhodoferax sp.]